MAATWLFICAILGTTLPWASGERVLGQEDDEFDFDGLPGAQHEFKMNVEAGREECFFQKLIEGGKLHVSFESIYGGDRKISLLLKHIVNDQILDAVYDKTDGFLELEAPYHGIVNENHVLSGGDRNIDLKVWTPYGELFHHIQFSASGGFEQQVLQSGPYAICLDNSMSRLNSKLVYVYIVTYVQDKWEEYVKEIDELHLTMENFTTSIEQVKTSISDALIHQAQSRMHVIKDWYLITGNNKYIQYWSILQCCVILISTGCQVYFVRRLFRYTNVKPAKPRA